MTEVAGGSHPGHSVLVVPVPALEPLVRARHEHYDADYVSADPTFAHAHVTVLGPWIDRAHLSATDLQGVERIARATSSFEVRFTRVETFPNWIIHLVPEPAEPFSALTAALWGAFPSCPPYAGAFGHVAPHVTLDALGPGVTAAVVRSWLEGQLPLRTVADRIQLSWYEAGGCRTLAAWPLTG